MNNSAALAEADGDSIGGLAAGTEDHFVAIGKETPSFSGRQVDRSRAPLGQLEQATARVIGISGYSSGRQQISRPQITAVARVMGDQLCDGPIHGPRAAAAQAKRFLAMLSHLSGANKGCNCQIDASAELILV